jgi:hypothetical protein
LAVSKPLQAGKNRVKTQLAYLQHVMNLFFFIFLLPWILHFRSFNCKCTQWCRGKEDLLLGRDRRETRKTEQNKTKTTSEEPDEV